VQYGLSRIAAAASLAVIDVDGVDVDVLPDDPPVLELGADGRFARDGAG
jgi:hypothetical protein